MKKIAITLLLVLTCTMQALAAKGSVEAVRALAQRIIPSHAANFEFKLMPQQNKKDVFSLQQKGEKIVVSGNNANAMAMGLNYYLNNFCHTTVSWYAEDAVTMPTKLPVVKEKITVPARVNRRFFLNYCTYGYTMPFFNWTEWERVIDWMALNGVNMPLAITGQETVWYNVWKQLGMNDNEIRAYFTGPAYLPWHRMANIDGWNGPLPMTWLDKQADLQKQIVTRERQLDMKPVLPAFAGHVPAQLKTLYPDANIKYLGKWAGFADQYRCHFLDPSDPLFAKIQRLFIDEQTRMYGTDHVYGTDPFNEVDPPSWDTAYLSKVAGGIYKTMAAADPKAEWLQMAWLFWHGRKKWTPERVKALLTGVEKGKMIMLDYFCENKEIWKITDGFYGQPYIWCYLGNFGGNTTLTGNLKESARRLDNTLVNGGSNLTGVGGTLEGFDINQMSYEFILGKAWNTGVDENEWIKTMADRHLGYSNEAARKAWQLLYDEVLVQAAGSNGLVATYRPKMDDDGWHYTHVDYNPQRLNEAWQLLTQVPSVDRTAYVCDLIAIGRQAMGNMFMEEKISFDKAFHAGNMAKMKQHATVMNELLNDLDALCAYNNRCTLGKWIDDARAYAADKAEADYYEHNARNIISTWGGKLNDYANRGWAGMFADYYAGRWALYFDEAMQAVSEGRDFNQTLFDRKASDYEAQWVNSRTTPVSTPSYDILTFSRMLIKKYGLKTIASMTDNCKNY